MGEAAYKSLVGTTIAGKYRVESVLGVGGMGAVLEAVNLWTERRVALKVLHEDREQQASVVTRFIQEARAFSKVPHPNIVEILDLGQQDGMLYLVQEFLLGKTLRKHLEERGKLSFEEAMLLLAPVMEGLSAVHRAGLVHRDLKPENLFLAQAHDGKIVPKIIDFGIVKNMEPTAGQAPLTNTGAMLGTPYYMAPEQCFDPRSTDHRADVWAMGVVWYEVLSGTLPTKAESFPQIILKITSGNIVPLQQIAPWLSANVCSAVMHALERDSSQRWQSMDAFLSAMRSCQSSQVFSPPTPAPVVGSFPPSQAPASVTSPSVTPGVAQSSGGSSNSSWLSPAHSLSVTHHGVEDVPAVPMQKSPLRFVVPGGILLVMAVMFWFFLGPERTEIVVAEGSRTPLVLPSQRASAFAAYRGRWVFQENTSNGLGFDSQQRCVLQIEGETARLECSAHATASMGFSCDRSRSEGHLRTATNYQLSANDGGITLTSGGATVIENTVCASIGNLVQHQQCIPLPGELRCVGGSILGAGSPITTLYRRE